MAQFVDWDLAAATAGALGKSGPRVTLREATDGGGRAAPRWPTRRPGTSQAYTGLTPAGTPAAGARGRPPGLGRGQHRRAAPGVAPLLARLTGGRRAGRVRRRGRLPGHRRAGRHRAGLSVRPGARPVRGVLRPTRASCCWSRRTSSRWSASSRRSRATSGSGSACTRSPTAPSSPRCRGCGRTSWRGGRRSSTPAARRADRRAAAPRGGRARRRAARPGEPGLGARPGADPGPAGGAGPDHRADDPARRARRVRDGRRRPRGGAERRRDPGRSSTGAARAATRWRGCIRRLLGIEVKMRQYAEGRKFVHGVVERVGMAGFNKVFELAADPAAARRAGRPARLDRPGHGAAAGRSD